MCWAQAVTVSTVRHEEVFKLCTVWDARGLLRIFPVSLGPSEPWQLTKVFNCFKNSQVDRQIGDRRSLNQCEGRIAGPSRFLPTAASVLRARFSMPLSWLAWKPIDLFG